MTRVLTWPEIAAALEGIDLREAMREAFLGYSEGRAVVPPVGELLLDDPRGEVHIKYGYVREQPDYVVKIASGFPGNVDRGLPPSGGVMVLFDRLTGATRAVLLDDGRLTDQRTAAAGALASEVLMPPVVKRIGLLGTGTQARLQLDHLRAVTPCREVLVWGRSDARVDALIEDLASLGYAARPASEPAEVGVRCQLIVTTTAATAPLIEVVRPGTHLTAIGSDTEAKQELAAELVADADVLVVDSRDQARTRGELARAVAAGALTAEGVLELGEVLAGRGGRRAPEEVTIADLTGVAVQDLAIARAVVDRVDREAVS